MGCIVSYGPGTHQSGVDHKATDIAVEALKQLITLSVGVLALTVTFLKDILADARGSLTWSWLLPFSWMLFLVTIYSAIVALAQAARLLARGHRGYAFDRIRPTGGGPSPQALARTAQLCFFAALCALTLFAYVNRTSITSKATKPEIPTGAPGPPGKDG